MQGVINKNKFCLFVINIWNSLLIDIKNLTPIKSFMSLLSKFLLHQMLGFKFTFCNLYYWYHVHQIT